jgi:ArsR family transcriptional regulator
MATVLDNRTVTAAARRFKALADENRLRILGMLLDGERCVCDLTAALDAGQSLLSHHLRTLREAGFVTDRRVGRWAYYSIVPETFAELEAYLGRAREAVVRTQSDTCC